MHKTDLEEQFEVRSYFQQIYVGRANMTQISMI